MYACTQEVWEWKESFLLFTMNFGNTDSYKEVDWTQLKRVKRCLRGWYGGHTNAICYQKLWTQRFAQMQIVQICFYFPWPLRTRPRSDWNKRGKSFSSSTLSFGCRVIVFPVGWFSQLWELWAKAHMSDERRTPGGNEMWHIFQIWV